MSLYKTEDPIVWMAHPVIGQNGVPVKTCWGCVETNDSARACSLCYMVEYCDAKCAEIDWKQGGHNKECPLMRKLSPESKEVILSDFRLRLITRLIIRVYNQPELKEKVESMKNANDVWMVTDEYCTVLASLWNDYLETYVNNSLFFRDQLKVNREKFLLYGGIVMAGNVGLWQYQPHQQVAHNGYGLYTMATKYDHDCVDFHLRFTNVGKQLRLVQQAPFVDGQKIRVNLLPSVQVSGRELNRRRELHLDLTVCLNPSCEAMNALEKLAVKRIKTIVAIMQKQLDENTTDSATLWRLRNMSLGHLHPHRNYLVMKVHELLYQHLMRNDTFVHDVSHANIAMEIGRNLLLSHRFNGGCRSIDSAMICRSLSMIAAVHGKKEFGERVLSICYKVWESVDKEHPATIYHRSVWENRRDLTAAANDDSQSQAGSELSSLSDTDLNIISLEQSENLLASEAIDHVIVESDGQKEETNAAMNAKDIDTIHSAGGDNANDSAHDPTALSSLQKPALSTFTATSEAIVSSEVVTELLKESESSKAADTGGGGGQRSSSPVGDGSGGNGNDRGKTAKVEEEEKRSKKENGGELQEKPGGASSSSAAAAVTYKKKSKSKKNKKKGKKRSKR